MKLFLNKLKNYIIIEIIKKLSFDTNDFDISFVRGFFGRRGNNLNRFHSKYYWRRIIFIFKNFGKKVKDILICGGGRKNKILMEKIKKIYQKNINLKLIDDYKIDGDFIESQAFAFFC